jgi:acyl-CoA thioesterase FadM
MNLWLRLFVYALTCWWRPAIRLPAEPAVLRMRVSPLDLDTSLHMNNGRYLALMDLGRVELMVRSGLWRAVLREGWTPIASGVQIRFRRELRMFDRFDLVTRILSWDEASLVMEQVFVIVDGPKAGQVAARALFKGGLYDRKARAFLPMQRLMAEIGVEATSPEPSDDVRAFLASDDAIIVRPRADVAPSR